MAIQANNVERCTAPIIRKKTQKDLRYFWAIVGAAILVIIGVGIYMARQEVDNLIGIILYFLIAIPITLGIFILIAAIVLLIVYIILYFTKRTKNRALCQRDPDVFIKSI